MVKCPECGVRNTADSAYCRRCGAQLQDRNSRDETTEPHPAEARARIGARQQAQVSSLEATVLQIRSPVDREGELLALIGEIVTIGRTPESDLFLDDVTVSRRHARIVVDPEGYTIEDEGSLNGTYVNRRRVERHQLFDGDELQIGKFKLAFLERKQR